jgi:hypothetical protein
MIGWSVGLKKFQITVIVTSASVRPRPFGFFSVSVIQFVSFLLPFHSAL